jgi:hypothetical protein
LESPKNAQKQQMLQTIINMKNKHQKPIHQPSKQITKTITEAINHQQNHQRIVTYSRSVVGTIIY